jgi:next-to-BRCA1 protein 1
MGDRRRTTKSTSTETVAPAISNAATQVQNQEPEKQEPLVEEDTKPAEAIQLTTPSKFEAAYVRDTVIDGTVMAPNTVFMQTWTMRNTGSVAWPKGSSVRFVGGDALFNIDTNHPTSVGTLVSSMGSNELTESVAPMESADFTVTLKSPSRVGRAISYWRLKTQGGVVFGDNLWCDIQVAEPAVPVIQEPEPAVKVEITEAETETLNTESSGTMEAEVDEQSTSESQMIFPKLEKESPVASTHEALSTADDALMQEDEHDLVDEVESLTLDEDETEDGFMTDEEYDILDASDQEYAVEAQKSQK